MAPATANCCHWVLVMSSAVLCRPCLQQPGGCRQLVPCDCHFEHTLLQLTCHNFVSDLLVVTACIYLPIKWVDHSKFMQAVHCMLLVIVIKLLKLHVALCTVTNGCPCCCCGLALLLWSACAVPGGSVVAAAPISLAVASTQAGPPGAA